MSGVNVALNLLIIYALSGVFYAFGGMLEAGRIGSATNNLGFMYELDAIAACVVGGVSFSGGVGTVLGVVTGVIIFTVINYGLTYIGVNPYWQYIIKGAIIIFAVALDSLKYARKSNLYSPYPARSPSGLFMPYARWDSSCVTIRSNQSSSESLQATHCSEKASPGCR